MLQIDRLAVLADNYIFVLFDPETKMAAVVDPAVAPPVLRHLQTLGAELVAIFNTHHHSDHVGGNAQLIQHFPKVTVYGGAADQGRIPGQQVFLKEGDHVQFAHYTGQVLFVPGHTKAHIAYYFPPIHSHEPGNLFCGDTLFSGGCGRLFEGTPSQMVHSLDKFRHLPDQTQVWCAHEYTLKNLQFALAVDPENPHLHKRFAEVTTARNNHQATIPSNLGMEKQTNPFLRWDQPQLQRAVKSQDPVQTFTRLRAMKDQF